MGTGMKKCFAAFKAKECHFYATSSYQSCSELNQCCCQAGQEMFLQQHRATEWNKKRDRKIKILKEKSIFKWHFYENENLLNMY